MRPVDRLHRDVESLSQLMSGEEPSLVRVRSLEEQSFYLMGDAKGKGFGSAFWDGERIDWESGHYCLDFQGESSNF